MHIRKSEDLPTRHGRSAMLLVTASAEGVPRDADVIPVSSEHDRGNRHLQPCAREQAVETRSLSA
ncbi:hypothetical protein GCM10007898_30730 [Dyella flagellata]|uniref:Uncharacterized protein n=1 Tax=Dyella flagellata TaxID=1867833 RepID=A0ABQ5XE51_9GAMM|nr:hypothetical protein GCM10007898_30730 [Dyella flagellata]